MKINTLTIAKRLVAGLAVLMVFPTLTAIADPATDNTSKLVATVTGYSSTPDQTDDTPEIMASGKKVFDGALACPRKYPFGTRVHIGGKEYVCEDRMHIRFDDRFDIWFPSRKAARYFGIKKLEVQIVAQAHKSPIAMK